MASTSENSRLGESSWAPIASIVGTIGVVLSLILLAWEVRQNTIATRAAMYDRLGEASGQYYWEVVGNDALSEVFHQVFLGSGLDTFSGADQTRFRGVGLGFLTHLENTWKQHEAGVVGEDIFEGYGWKDGFLQTRAFLEWWDSGQPRSFFSEDFVADLDSHLEPFLAHLGEGGPGS
jgi:hypothetical protein